MRTLTLAIYITLIACGQPSHTSAASRYEVTEGSDNALQKVHIADSFRDCADCPDMIIIPDGRYLMGSTAAEIEDGINWTFPAEKIVHDVNITKPFAVSKYPITRTEFATFAHNNLLPEHGCKIVKSEAQDWPINHDANWEHPGFMQTDKDPVVCINWHDAKLYVEWLSRSTGKHYRLLSESEWEYVARAGTTTQRYWGNDYDHTLQCLYANGADIATQRVYEDWTGADCDDGYAYTSPVGTYRPNSFGVYDMLGNVLQWVEDCFQDTYEGASVDGTALTPAVCLKRVLRGGAWNISPRSIRAANRFRNQPSERINNYGIRVGRDITE